MEDRAKTVLDLVIQSEEVAEEVRLKGASATAAWEKQVEVVRTMSKQLESDTLVMEQLENQVSRAQGNIQLHEAAATAAEELQHPQPVDPQPVDPELLH